MKAMKFLVAFLLAFALAIPTSANADTTFSDISADYRFAEEITELVDANVISGYGDGTFRPDKTVNRAQAAILIAKALELDLDNTKPTNYKDVSKKSAAYKHIAAVTEAGIMQGSQTGFNPDGSLTRAQMAIVLTKAFDLKGNNKTSFKDVPKDYYAHDHIDAILTHGITVGYTKETFEPNKSTTRAQFAAFLSRALDNTDEEKEEVVALLKKVYENEFALDSYSFDGDFNFGLSLPEALQTPEMEMFTDMLADVQVEMAGSYVKDPMRLEANMKLTLSGEVDVTMNMPMIMTEEKMWFKLPQIPMAPLPEELDGKFIEIDLAELEEMEGQPAGSLDYDLQMELASAINNLFVEQFGPDFYQFTKADALQIPDDIDVQKVVKFELTNETLQPFVEKMMAGFLPEFFEVMQDPKYAEALGMTAEELEEAKEGIALINENLDEIIQSINDTVTVNKLDQHIVINENDFIAYDVMNMDLDFTAEEGVFGLKMGSKMKKSNINEDIEFTMEIPNADEVITMEELEDLMFEEMEDFDF